MGKNQELEYHALKCINLFIQIMFIVYLPCRRHFQGEEYSSNRTDKILHFGGSKF